MQMLYTRDRLMRMQWWINCDADTIYKKKNHTPSGPVQIYRHCEYQSFENLQVNPAAHVVQPEKLTPPH